MVTSNFNPLFIFFIFIISFKEYILDLLVVIITFIFVVVIKFPPQQLLLVLQMMKVKGFSLELVWNPIGVTQNHHNFN